MQNVHSMQSMHSRLLEVQLVTFAKLKALQLHRCLTNKAGKLYALTVVSA